MPSLSTWFLLIIPGVILLHLVVSPYTKVEESFNVQAIHDILKNGVPFASSALKFKALFDHMTFPGAVPRTFIGALVVAGLSKPLIWIGNVHGLAAQTTARAVLGFLNASALIVFARSIRREYGDRTALWYTFLQASQFHVIYYASRPLPNMFAFCLSTFALSSFLPHSAAPTLHPKRLRLAFYLLTLATVIFRSEIALLMASHAGLEVLKAGSIERAYQLIRRAILPVVVVAALVGIGLSVSVDTYFWQSRTYLWPELSAFWFNVFPKDHSGASAWGTSPWHWYFTSAIPRLFLGPSLLLLPYGLLFSTQRARMLDNLIPPLGYTVLYSVLPHKETRFLFPIVPSLTLAAAIPASSLSIGHDRISKLITAALALATTLSFLAAHVILLPLSAQSYPGGHALKTLHTHHGSLAAHAEPAHSSPIRPQIHVHLTNLALQSGVTRFLEQPTPSTSDTAPLWVYDKSSNATAFLTPAFWSQFAYVVVEDPARVIGAWSIVAEIPALRRSPPRLTRDTARGPESELLVLGRGRDRKPRCLGWKGVAGREECRFVDDGLFHLFRAMYGESVAWGYGVLHDVLRRGYGIGGKGVTGGRWVDWGLETRLYILERDETGIEPNAEPE